MRILIANDDGIDAPGLALLERAARALSEDIWTVAPDGKRTAASSSISLDVPLTLRRLDERRYSCSGTPADCIVTAMAWLFAEERRPVLVLSGINDGRNVAEDLAYSGTLGIAREASFWGVPAVALSRVKRPELAEADLAWVEDLLKVVWQKRDEWWVEGHWLSVNLPARLPAAIVEPRIGRDKIGRTAEVVEEEGDATVLVLPRGRAHRSKAGDENDLIDKGFATINWLNWFGESRLSAQFVGAIGKQ
ncbi:MAG TPA: 5'/3'-nucleotidase SurE [Pararhizobium sp.]|nr:5'/3'-nucleotidase SurE [Pararhizobium sp.]